MNIQFISKNMNNTKDVGFCDLNIILPRDPVKVKPLMNCLIEYGYKTIAINEFVDDSSFTKEPKKVKSKDIIPLPCNIVDLIKEFEGKLKILRRLTVSFSEVANVHKLNQSRNLKKYDIFAVIPKTADAMQHALSVMEIDLISFDPTESISPRSSRKLYKQAANRGVYFEIMYSPALIDSRIRKNIIQLSHFYHLWNKSKNVILTSGASKNLEIRGPYDIANLGLLFALSEEQSKRALTYSCRSLLVKAGSRLLGKTLIRMEETPIHKKKKRKITEESGSNVIDEEI